MKLQLNGTQITVQVTTLADLLATQGFRQSKVATAVNSRFIPATARAECMLTDGDQIEVLAPMQGG